jgi:hypothetical protein
MSTELCFSAWFSRRTEGSRSACVSFPEEAATWIVTKGFNGVLVSFAQGLRVAADGAVAAALVHALPGR